MADVAAAYEDAGSNERRIWKLLAYAGRYGHQPLTVLKGLTMRELALFVAQLNEIVQEENGPARPTHHED